MTQSSAQSEDLECQATGVVLIHIKFKSYLFTKTFEINALDLQNVENDMNIYFQSISNELNKEISKLNSENMNFSPQSRQATKLSDGFVENSLKLDCSIENNYIPITETNTNVIYHDETKFKSPPDDQNKSTVFYPINDHSNYSNTTRHHLIKNRISSSTCTSTDPTSSSSNNRFSTVSISTHSDESVDVWSKGKRDSILVAETSDSSMEKIEPNYIENTDDEENVRVYAKWKTEKYFYSGTVKGHTFRQEVPVHFSDDTIDDIKVADILFMELLPINTMVLVDVNNKGSFLKNFVISSHSDIKQFKSKSKKGYTVRSLVNNKCYIVSRDLVSVHIDVVKQLISNQDDSNSEVLDNHNTSLSNVSVDNILSGKRNIKLKRFSQFVSPDIMRTKRCNSPSLLTISTSPGKYKSTVKRRKNVLVNHNLTLNDNTESGSLLSNYYFLITHELVLDDPCAISKDEVEDMLKELGGNVIETPTKDRIEYFRRKECFIVLIVIGRSYSTIKFMMSLAIGNIPIVQVEWLQNCFKTMSILPFQSYLLSRGLDEDNKEIFQSLNGKDNLDIFKNKSIWIVTQSLLTFGYQWKEVLEFAGARVTLMDTSDFTSNISPKNCDFAVIEKDGVTRNCINYLKERYIPIVDIKYIITCLVHNVVIDIDVFLE